MVLVTMSVILIIFATIFIFNTVHCVKKVTDLFKNSDDKDFWNKGWILDGKVIFFSTLSCFSVILALILFGWSISWILGVSVLCFFSGVIITVSVILLGNRLEKQNR